MGDVQVAVTQIHPIVVTIRLSGDIDQRTTGQLRAALVDVIVHRKPDRLIIDLDAVTALDDVAVGVLRAGQAAADDAGVTVSIHTTGSRIAADLDEDGIHHAA
jgi:anti-anti-sigma factor